MIHDVDRLAQIRTEIKALQTEADTIRQRLLTQPNGQCGTEYHSSVRQHLIVRPVHKAAQTKQDANYIAHLYGKH